MMYLLLPSPSATRIHADERGESYRLTFLPRDIAQSYFPTGEDYLIPGGGKMEILIERARDYEMQGNYRQALRYYSMASRRAEGTPAAAYVRFKQCSLEEHTTDANTCLSDLIISSPDFPLIDAVRFELAFRLYLQGKYAEALNYLSAIEQNETGGAMIFTPSAYYFSGIVLAGEEDHTGALASFEKAVESMNAVGGEDYRDMFPGLYLEMGKSHFAVGNYEQAEDLFKRIYGTAPLALQQAESLWYLGRVYAIQTRWEMAYEAYVLVEQQYPGTPFALKAQPERERIRDTGVVEGGKLVQQVYDDSILTGSYVYGVEEAAEEYPTTADSGREGYAVQIGSFSDRQNAERLAGQLQELGFAAFLHQARVNDRDFYRVRVGYYPTREDAAVAMKDLQERGFHGFIIQDQ